MKKEQYMQNGVTMMKELIVGDSVTRYIDTETLEKITSGELLSVSGIPLMRDNPETYYNRNRFEEGVILQPTFVSMANIDKVVHNHLEDKFIGFYPRLWGVDLEHDTDYCFGIRGVLQFSVEIFDPSK